MNSGQWRKIEELFNAAIELDNDQRNAYLNEACPDESIRTEVLKLLAADDKVSTLHSPVAGWSVQLAEERKASLPPGHLIGHYQIERELGRGGMGEVYLAQDLQLNRKVAIKVLPQHLTNDAERVRRFQNEARAASALNHPNIVTIHEIGNAEGLPFIVTEFIEGETLRSFIKRGSMGFVDIIDLAIQIATALSAAHQAGITHRDIKPENIMVRSDGFVKLVDFGLAKLTEQLAVVTSNSLMTAPGRVMGTVRYMSPEQARALDVDYRTDIFSLGILLYEMIAGRLPFDGETNSDVMASILTAEPTPLNKIVPQLPPQLGEIIGKALRKKKEERYQSMQELVNALTEVKQYFINNDIPRKAQTTDESLLITTSQIETRNTLQPPNQAKSGWRVLRWAAALLLPAVLTASLILAVNRYRTVSTATQNVRFQNIELTKLTNAGKYFNGQISTDGRYYLYIGHNKGGRALFVEEVATGKELQLTPYSPYYIWSMHFSNDTQYVYYLQQNAVDQHYGTLFKIPTAGGSAVKLVSGTNNFKVSPDDRWIVFTQILGEPLRINLHIIGADGSGQRLLTVRGVPDTIFGMGWHPQGNKIAFTASITENNRPYSTLYEIGTDGSGEKRITAEQWYGSSSMPVWTRDGNNIIVSVIDKKDSGRQLWQISYPEGIARKITNDLNDYGTPSLLDNDSTIAASVINNPANIFIFAGGDRKRAKQINTGNGNYNHVSFTPNGQLLYTSLQPVGHHIWISDQDGGNARQLTTGPHRNLWPSMTPDGKTIAFASNRTGQTAIWRMNSDGSHQRQLTYNGNNSYPQVSPDGKWIYFASFYQGRWTIYKISIDGGEIVKVVENDAESAPMPSPDGKWLAFEFHDNATGKFRAAVMPLEGKGERKVFDITSDRNIRWAADSKGLFFYGSRNSNPSIWYQPLDGRPPQQYIDFDENQIYWFDVSRDGKQIVTTMGKVFADIITIKDISPQSAQP